MHYRQHVLARTFMPLDGSYKYVNIATLSLDITVVENDHDPIIFHYYGACTKIGRVQVLGEENNKPIINSKTHLHPIRAGDDKMNLQRGGYR